MVFIAIVEDEDKEAEKLNGMCMRYFEETQEECQIERFSDALAFLENYRPVYDIVFMDIALPYINGINAAKALREKDEGVILVFITSLAQYAVNGYEVNASDYIVKPYPYEFFKAKMPRIMRAVTNRKNKYLVVSFYDSKVRISILEIIYIEVRGHVLTIHCLNDKNIEIRKSLGWAEEILATPPFYFIRCNTCYLVNPYYIQSIDGYDCKIENENLVISRSRKKQFNDAYAAYLGSL